MWFVGAFLDVVVLLVHVDGGDYAFSVIVGDGDDDGEGDGGYIIGGISVLFIGEYVLFINKQTRLETATL